MGFRIGLVGSKGNITDSSCITDFSVIIIVITTTYWGLILCQAPCSLCPLFVLTHLEPVVSEIQHRFLSYHYHYLGPSGIGSSQEH